MIYPRAICLARKRRRAGEGERERKGEGRKISDGPRRIVKRPDLFCPR